jgi:predicted nucleic acid-binding protein
MSHLVDSDIIVDFTRGSAAAADYLDRLADAWSISMITCLELLAGARTQWETTDLDIVLSGYTLSRLTRTSPAERTTS